METTLKNSKLYQSVASASPFLDSVHELDWVDSSLVQQAMLAIA